MLLTKRLKLRTWTDADFAPFASMNADPRVMEHFPSIMTKEESDALANRICHEFETRGYGLWAVEELSSASFIGFLGLHLADFDAPFTPCIEIAWRLAFNYWGQGYAFEGASAVIEDAFHRLGLDTLMSWTAQTNHRSIKLMQKLGMRYLSNFEHPKLPKGHLLRPHVLYAITK